MRRNECALIWKHALTKFIPIATKSKTTFKQMDMSIAVVQRWSIKIYWCSSYTVRNTHADPHLEFEFAIPKSQAKCFTPNMSCYVMGSLRIAYTLNTFTSYEVIPVRFSIFYFVAHIIWLRNSITDSTSKVESFKDGHHLSCLLYRALLMTSSLRTEG